MKTLLHFDDNICHSLDDLRYYISQDLIPGTTIYEELLAYQRDGILAQWLTEGGTDAEKELAKKLRNLPSAITNNELICKVKQIVVGISGPTHKPHFSNYIELQQIRCFIDNRIVKFEEVSFHDFVGIITGILNQYEAHFLIDFKVIRTDNELFDVELLGNYDLSLFDKSAGQIVTVKTDPCYLTNGATYSLFVDKVALAEITVNPSKLSIKVNNVDINMIFVEGGTFTMGSSLEYSNEATEAEKPAHKVTLSDFYIGKYEVTQEEWLAVMDRNPSFFIGDRRPVESIEWNKCHEFIEKLNILTGKRFRLPTEAEWEYAARGGNRSQGYKYAGSNNADEVAWMDNICTHPVGQKQPNELGLFDMSGNVHEWCQDWWGYYNDTPQINPTGAKNGNSRVCRGGCWYSHYNSGYVPNICRSTYRCSCAPDNSTNYLGIRLVL